MARNNKDSFFERLMNLADRFFDGFNQFKAMSDKAAKENVEILDEKIPGFKESHERSLQSAAELGSKLESKVEKVLFGKDLYLGAGGEDRRAADMSGHKDEKKPSLKDRIHSASVKANQQSSMDCGSLQKPEQDHSQER